MNHKILLLTTMLVCSGFLQGAVPEYYRVLSGKVPEIIIDNPPLNRVQSPWVPDVEERQRNFGLAVLPPAVNPRPDFLWQEKKPEKRIRQFIGGGEFRSVWVVIHGLGEQKNVKISAAPLKNADGQTIAPENFLFQRVFWGGRRTAWDDRNCYLLADAPWEIPAGQSLWVWTTLHAPAGSRGGVYRGEFTVESDSGRAAIPVEMAVLDGGDFSIQVPWGVFMPGHYNMKNNGLFVNYAPTWFTADRLANWVRLWKSRGAISPFPYHIYPEIGMKEGRIEVEIPMVDELTAMMKQEKMGGPLLLDMRWFCWWSAAAAEEIVKRKLDVNTATLNVRGDKGLFIAKRGLKEYPNPDLSREIFRRTMKAVDARCGNLGIPVLYLTEEEIGYHGFNGFSNPKTIGYETFNRALMEVVGRDKVCLVDNSLGYGYPGVDRGARDNVKYRSYNNWTQKALDDAAAQDAVVWLYNFGADRRLAHYMMRLGAKAFHQWADQWGTPEDNNNFWTFSAINDDGAVTTVQLERMAMGMRDLTYYLLLDKYADKAEKAGKKELAVELRSMKQRFFGELNVNRVEYQQETSAMTDADHDRIRWQCVLAVSKVQSALGEKPLWHEGLTSGTKAGGQIPVSVDRDNEETAASGGKIAQILETRTPPVLDGENKDAAWRLTPGLSNFRWTAEKEARMRAMASSEDEFNRQSPPSGSHVQLAYDDKALYFLASANHVGPGTSKHDDDDPLMWSDDVFEFFFLPAPGEPLYQLIVNSKGARTMLRGKSVMKDIPIRVAVKSPINGTGGTAHEIVIPWSVFGREGKPASGEVWQFNVCRNFNSWNQLSSWAQVPGSFGLADGKLVFGGFAKSGDLEVGGIPRELGVGANRLNLTWKATPGLICDVRNAENRPILRVKAPLKGVTLDFNIPESDTAKIYKLTLTDASYKKRAEIPILVGAQPLTASPASGLLVRGTPCIIDLNVKAGNKHLTDNPMTITFHSFNGSSTAQCLLQPGKSRLKLETDTIAPGKYKVEIKIKGLAAKVQFDLEILPGPF